MADLSWTEPGVEQVAPGVHRLPLPLPMDGLRAVNVYVVETDEGLVLIDGGWAIPESRQRFDAGLRELGHTARDIRGFLVTHMHRDHYTQAYVVAREVGARISLGLGDKATLDLIHRRDGSDVDEAQRERARQEPMRRRLVLCGAEHLAERWRAMTPTGAAEDVYGMPDEWLEGDRPIELPGRTLQAVHTPGHTQGHYVFTDLDAGLLFAGDHVLPAITPSIGFEPAFVQQPLRDFLGSLAKVAALPDLTVLPAHGPVAPSSHARAAELTEHHRVRLDQCAAAVAAGRRTAWEVAGDVPWTSRGRTRDDLGVFDAVLASFETLAHLELLGAEGRVARTEADGVVGFSPIPPPA